MTLDAHLQALSCREAALLGRALSGTATERAVRRSAEALLEPETLREALEALRDAAPEPRARLRERLAHALAPDAPRVAPVHASWIEAALARIPPALRERATPWLREAHPLAPPEQLAPALRWLQTHCVAAFPRGPTHLDPAALAPTPHPGHLAALPLERLEALVEQLGLHALGVALADAGARRAAAVLAALPEAQRARFAQIARSPAELAPERLRPLRLRLQSALLELSGRGPGDDLGALASALGLRLLALLGATRFDRELEFLAVRLPRERGRQLIDARTQSARRAPELARAARALADASLRAALAPAPGAPR